MSDFTYWIQKASIRAEEILFLLQSSGAWNQKSIKGPQNSITLQNKLTKVHQVAESWTNQCARAENKVHILYLM